MNTPHRILAHNILRAIVGISSSGRPHVQPDILIASNSLSPTLAFLTTLHNVHACVPTQPSLDFFLTSFAGEWQSSIIPLLHELAYSPVPPNPAHYGDGLSDPKLWLCGSYHRIANLIHFSNTTPSPAYLDSAIRVLAATEATEVIASFNNTVVSADIILFDPDIFARESGEDSGDII